MQLKQIILLFKILLVQRYLIHSAKNWEQVFFNFFAYKFRPSYLDVHYDAPPHATLQQAITVYVYTSCTYFLSA